MSAPQTPLITYTPRRTDPPNVFSSSFQGFLSQLPASIDGMNAISIFINNTANQFNIDKNAAANAKTLALQYSQDASNSASTASSASQAAHDYLQATIIAANDIGAIDMQKAKQAVKRQNMKFFKLNLL